MKKIVEKMEAKIVKIEEENEKNLTEYVAFNNRGMDRLGYFKDEIERFENEQEPA